MWSSCARWVACLAVAACALLAAGPASARGRREAFFRLDLRTGKVELLSELTARRPVLPWPAPLSDQRRSVTSDERTLFVFEWDGGAPAASRIVWQLTLPGTGAGWIPWQLVQGNTVTYAWREEVPGPGYQHRDIIRALDMDTRKVLWERVDPSHDPPAAAGVGGDHLVVDQAKEVLLLETRTGRVARRLAKSEPSFAVTSPSPGRLWVEAGEIIECIDVGTAKPVWRAPKQGNLLWLLPIPGSDDWLVKTDSYTYRLRAADGHEVWSFRSTSFTRPLLSGDRFYDGTLVVEDPHQRARMSLIARDLRTGKVLREYPLGVHEGFFDQGSVAAVEVRDGRVDVATELIVLD